MAASCGRSDPATPPSSLPARTTSSPLVLPEKGWTLSADDIEVFVQAFPYELSIRDKSGHVVLESSRSTADGYSALGWARGSTHYSSVLIAGYTDFSANLEPWQDELRVVEVQHADRSLRLVLQGRDSGPRVSVVHTVRSGTLRVEASLLDGQTARAWSTAFQTPEDEGFLGFGERFNRTDQRGHNVWSWIEEGGVGAGEGSSAGVDNPLPSGEMMTYYAVPYFLSTRGYAFWLDTSFRSEFNLASEQPDAWRAWHVGDQHAYEIYLPSSQDDRPWPYHLIDRFTRATGRPMLPPAWAFGPRRRVNRNAIEQGRPEIELMRELDLAVTGLDDAMHFFPSAHHLETRDNLHDWVQRSNALGYRVNSYYNSFINKSAASPIADFASEGKRAGYYVQQENGRHPDLKILTGKDTPSLYLVDFTNPDAARWYADSFDWALKLGYSGWMYDFGEYVPASAKAHDGRSGEELHNLYPVLYAKALHSAMEASDSAGQWLAFQRSGYTGASAYVPFVWSGDPAASFEAADGLPSMVPAGVNLGISGAPHWGGDIGGFHCVIDGSEAADAELVTRWIQMGSMSSNMMDQDACVGGDKQAKASIWSSTEALNAWKKYARLHTRLFPYLYSLAQEATATGAPTMRHPFLEHPDQPELRDTDDAYYFGPSLYVAPVLERGARSVTRTLPPGNFLDWHDEELIEGSRSSTQRVTIAAQLSKLPLMLRENQLVPLLDSTIDTLAQETSAQIVGRQDVANVYDVVGFLARKGTAQFEVWDGTELSVRRSGEFSPPPELQKATTVQELKTCLNCYHLQSIGPKLARLRVSTGTAKLDAGGLQLRAQSSRRIRWDLYIMK